MSHFTLVFCYVNCKLYWFIKVLILNKIILQQASFLYFSFQNYNNISLFAFLFCIFSFLLSFPFLNLLNRSSFKLDYVFMFYFSLSLFFNLFFYLIFSLILARLIVFQFPFLAGSFQHHFFLFVFALFCSLCLKLNKRLVKCSLLYVTSVIDT